MDAVRAWVVDAPARTGGVRPPARADGTMTRTQAPIADHAMIGDTRTAGLVTGDGTVDWMCVPRFDGEPLFGALIDAEHGGVFEVRVLDVRSRRRAYRRGSATVETAVTAGTGAGRAVDGLVPAVRRHLLPQSLLVRQVHCDRGRLRVRVLFDPRLGLPGRPPSRVTGWGHAAVTCDWGSLAVTLTASGGLRVGPGAPTEIELAAGDVLTLALSVVDRSPAMIVAPERAHELLIETDARWRDWAATIEYEGAHRDAVVRSLVTLRLLTYAPSGAPVAAPTTSLPEALEGSRNWDYRYAWPRDASIGLVAFLATGKHDLAHQFMHWLLHASRLTRPRMDVLYGLYGTPAPAEREVDVSGYRGAAPVRVGNEASTQHQLDVYGWVLDAAWLLERSGHPVHGETWRALSGFADLVAKMWRRRDAGIWEVRGDQAHYVHSKLMAWLALDRALRLSSAHRTRRSRVERWRRERAAVALEVRERGIDRDRQTYVWRYGDKDVDAALLILPVIEFERRDSPLLRGTIAAIRDELEAEPGIVYRYRPGAEGLEGREGAFLPCSFWLVQALARMGDVDEADALFRSLLDRANDVGLFGEEIEPLTGETLGNFPQALTHAALVQAALALRDARQESSAA